MNFYKCKKVCDKNITKKSIKTQRSVNVAINVNVSNIIVLKNVIVIIVIDNSNIIIVNNNLNICNVINNNNKHKIICVFKCVVIIFIYNIIQNNNIIKSDCNIINNKIAMYIYLFKVFKTLKLK